MRVILKMVTVMHASYALLTLLTSLTVAAVECWDALHLAILRLDSYVVLSSRTQLLQTPCQRCMQQLEAACPILRKTEPFGTRLGEPITTDCLNRHLSLRLPYDFKNLAEC